MNETRSNAGADPARPLRVGFLGQPTSPIPSSGSISLWIAACATRLAKQHEIVVVSRRSRGGERWRCDTSLVHVELSTRFEDALASLVRRASRWVDRIARRRLLLPQRYYFSAVYYAGYAIRAGLHARRRKLDVLVVPNFSQFLPVLCALSPATRLVLLMQCDWLVELPREIAGRRARHAAAVLGCSRHVTEGIQRRLPALAERCFTVHNGADASALRGAGHSAGAPPSPPGAKRLVFVGRITPEKGVHVLLQAMQEVSRAIPDCFLFLIGPFGSNPPSPALVLGGDPASERFEALKPGYERRLRDAAQALGEHVRFVGVVPNDRLAEWYESCDVFVHPAVWDEPFGIVLAEAMACGLPVVSTRVGGIPEIVAHGETGILVEPDDPKALADAIVELLRDDDRRRSMGAAGKRRVEQEFSWDRTAGRLEEILLQARDA